MGKPKHIKLAVISTSTTYAELEAIEASEPRNERRTTTLPLSAIQVADQVFQWRSSGQDLMVREEHARELIRTARTVGEALAPVLVVPIGEKFYLVDGHHRIIAYRSMEWSRSVPVEYFEGSLYEAKLEALNRNVRSQLPLSTAEKSEAAWELVRNNKLAVKAISKQTSISERTVKSMRKAVKTLGAEAASEITWAEARRRDWKSDEDYDPDAAKREKAERVAAVILRNTGVSIRRDPRILADALEIIDSNIPNWMILNWSDRVKPLMDKYPDDFPEPLDI